MDTLTIKPRKFRPAVVEALLAEVATLDEATVLERMMPAGCYTEPAFFDFEQEEVFARSWICVGRVEQVAEPRRLPGDGSRRRARAGSARRGRRDPRAERHLPASRRDHPLPGKGQGAALPAAFLDLRFPGPAGRRAAHGRCRGGPSAAPDGAAAGLRLELWHGFIFVNLDPQAPPLAPSLAKLEPLWAGYEATGLKALPPAMSDKPLPWNWKVQVENFTDAYHPEYVHIGTHDFAPSVMEGDGVRFTGMKPGDNAIVRSVPMRTPDGGMMSDGWGPRRRFPPSPHCRPSSAGASPSPCCRPASP